MGFQPLISVIMPVYCIPEKLLRMSIESVLGQTYKHLELLIIDDGSTDHSGEICEEYADKDNRVRCWHTDNRGVSESRNYGIERAKGELLMFVDSDDFIDPWLLEQMMDVVRINDPECVICSCHHLKEDEAEQYESGFSELKIKEYSDKEILEELFYMGEPFDEMEITAVWGKLYKRELLNKVRFESDMHIGEDFVFNYYIFKQTEKVVCMNAKGYNYLLRPGSAIHGRYKQCYLNALKSLKKVIESCDDCDKDGIIARSVNIALVLFLMVPSDQEYNLDREKCINFIKLYRKAVLLNPKSRFKVRGALILSLVSFNMMEQLYKSLLDNKRK